MPDADEAVDAVEFAEISRRGVLAASGGVLASGLGAGRAAAADDRPTKTDLGIAAPHNQVLGTDGSGEKAYFASYGTTPVVVGEFDIVDFEFTRNYVLPRGMGAWTIAPLGDHIYVGTYDYTSHADIIDINTATDEVEVLASFPDETFAWDVEVADDGTLYAGSYPNCRVYEVDPATGDVRSFGPMAEGEEYVRSVAVGRTHVYAGVGSHAHLVRLDRETGERTQVLPDGLSDRSWVYGVDSVGDKLVANVQPGGIALLDKADPRTRWRWISPDADVTVRGIFEIVDGDVYTPVYGSSHGWRYYRYDVDGDAWEDLGSIPGYSFPDQYVRGDVVIGNGEDTVWKQDLSTGESRTEDLTDVGMRPSAAIAQSLATLGDAPVVASSGALSFHAGPSGESPGINGNPVTEEVTGEPKAMVSVGDELYMATYPGARLYRYTASGGEELLVDVGAEQNRPRAIDYQEATDLILMGTRPVYGSLGGALVTYRRGSGETTVHRNVVRDQSIRSVTSTGETVYLGSEIHGGNGSDPTATEARLAAWDPASESVTWEIAPVSGATGLLDLRAANGFVFGLADMGETVRLFVVHPRARRTVYATEVAGGGEFTLAADGNLYGALGNGITKIETDSFETTRYLPEFDHLAEIKSDGEGNLYAVGQDEYHLYRLDVSEFADGTPI